MKSFTAFGLADFPLVGAGDNVAAMIVEAATKSGLNLDDGDIVVAAQKIFSKAERRVIRLRDVAASEEAKKMANLTKKNAKFVELVLREAKNVRKASGDIILVEDRRGLVCINAGIDKSNVQGRGNFALLPEDPDRSAMVCRKEVEKLTGKRIAVVICDTYSRPFRRGQVNFAIGVAGIKTFKDYRGQKDLFGQKLKVKNVAVADEIAATAELLMGQATEATPVVILKGLGDLISVCDECGAKELQISSKEDLFSGAL